MTTPELLSELHRRGVILELVDGDRIRFRPKSAVQDLIPIMRERKQELLRAIAVPARVRGSEVIILTSNSEICFHCSGECTCSCVACGDYAGPGEYTARHCRSCKGTGRLAEGRVQ